MQLCEAAASGNLDLLKFAISHLPAPESINTPVRLFEEEGRKQSYCKLNALLHALFTLHKRTYGFSRESKAVLVQELVAARADVNCKFEAQGRAPDEPLASCRTLVSLSAAEEAWNISCYTPLTLAMDTRDFFLVQLLLGLRADPGVLLCKNPQWTALDYEDPRCLFTFDATVVSVVRSHYTVIVVLPFALTPCAEHADWPACCRFDSRSCIAGRWLRASSCSRASCQHTSGQSSRTGAASPPACVCCSRLCLADVSRYSDSIRVCLMS